MNKQLISTCGSVAICALPITSLAQTFNAGDTQIKFGGYIKLDAILTDTEYGQLAFPGRDFYVPALTPVSGESEGVKMDAHARQSRFFFTTTTPLDNGKTLGGRLEFDMMSTPDGDERITNGYSPEIRHAFFTYDNWLFGQTWSTFMDVDSLPDSLDFIGNTDGTIFVRQAQVRYTHGNFQLGVENPETTLTPFGGGARLVTDDNGMPDVVIRYNVKADWGTMSIAGIARELAYDTGTFDDASYGFGVSVSGKINLPNRGDLRFTINSGEGIGRYMGLNSINDAVLTAGDGTAEVEAIRATGYSLAYRHLWSDKWRSNFIYSGLTADNDIDYTGVETTKTTNSGAANLLYQASSKLLFGAELRYANREIESGLDGDMKRLQFSAKYDF